MKYVKATEKDLFRLYSAEVLERWEFGYWDEWSAYCAKEGNNILGMSGYTLKNNTAWFFMDVLERIKRPVMYRYGVRFLKHLRESGITDIRAICDETKPKAREFMERLGFEQTEDELDGVRVWKWQHYQH